MDGANIQHLLAMILYMLAVIAIGIVFARRANKDAESYFLGGRSLGPWVTAFSAEASDMSGYLLMGLPGLAYWTGLADAAKAKLESGELHVFDCSTFTVSGANVKDTMKVDADGHLTSYMADVNTDEAYTGDTEVVHDGYFSESEFRSAPYFDLFIDGINTLDTAF